MVLGSFDDELLPTLFISKAGAIATIAIKIQLMMVEVEYISFSDDMLLIISPVDTQIKLDGMRPMKIVMKKGATFMLMIGAAMFMNQLGDIGNKRADSRK